jgi:hypothetical protein
MANDFDTDMNDDDDPSGDTFDVNDFIDGKKPKVAKEPKEVPMYQVYADSKIPVSKAYGSLWRTMIDSSLKANELIYEAWEQCFSYYNNHQVKIQSSSKGTFSRGDITENVVYSNVNVMLPAVYGRDPDIAVNTTDKEDEKFAECAHNLLNALLKGKNLLNCKPKVKKAVGVALMTNYGVLKLDYVLKADSSDSAMQSLIEVTQEIEKAKNAKALENAYGKLAAIESVVNVFESGGPKLKNVMAKNLVIDPVSEMPDGTDAGWMAERCFIPTNFLKHKFTRKGEDKDCYYYIFKPSHKAVFTAGSGNSKDDAYGLVLETLGAETSFQENEEVGGYRSLYYTECWMVWDKATRRTALFAADDWTYPLWVWDNYTKTTRFFPYFIIGFGLSTGQTTTVGEVSYYLDQQDEINQINRQVSRIRNSIFNFFFYNSNKLSQADAELLMQAVKRGFIDEQSVVGVKVPEGSKIGDVFEALAPPSLQYEALFNKEPTINSINRISNTSDAIRGVQYKTNTNEASVQSYQDAARMSVGAKIEVVEDVMADLCKALLEQCVQNMSKNEVEGLIGKKLSEGWQNMSLEEYNKRFALDIVPGTSEKPNSVFKKKEAIQVAQAIGQFASAAPMTSMKVALRVLEQAFTEVVIKPEDWDLMEKEMEMNMMRGNSTGANAPPQPGQNGPPPPQPGGGAPVPGGGGPGAAPAAPGGIPPELANLPPEIKKKVMEMHAAGAPPEQIAQLLKQAVGAQGAPGAPPPGGPPQAGPPPVMQ